VRWFFNCGDGSNTKVELVGAWATFIMEKVLHLHHLHILGDSKVIIEWLQWKCKLHATKIEGWKCRVRDLQKNFQGTHFQHIYRETNEEADSLSKRALKVPKGILLLFHVDQWNRRTSTNHKFLSKKKKRFHCWNSLFLISCSVQISP
jgi:ribonuclease HI